MVIIDGIFLREYLRTTLEDDGVLLPDSVTLDGLTQAFMEYLEVDIYEWLRDNYRAYFRDLDWDSVSQRPQ